MPAFSERGILNPIAGRIDFVGVVQEVVET
jgi:hypothetical protein